MADHNQQIAHFENICRAHGLKMTHQRLEIFHTLVRSSEHPSAETLYKMLEKKLPTLSLDTVYRTLATFVELGLVKRVETPGSQARFEAKIEQHHHFFCDQCGQLIDFTWHSFDEVQLPDSIESIGTIRDKNVVIHGVCNHCQNSDSD